MRSIGALLVVSMAAAAGVAWGGEWRGPTVVLEPGDVTALRGNIVNPLGPSHVYRPLPSLPQPGIEALQRDLRRDLDRLPGRRTDRSPAGEAGPRLKIAPDPLGPRALPAHQDRTDRARAAAALEAFRTLRPNARETPLLERDLDRLERPTDLGQ